MNAQETLAQIDHIMTEVDLELYQWQTDLDMMSFIGYNASFELWTNDDPPVVISGSITTEALVAAAGKELRVMNYLNGEPTQVGTAVISPDGTIVAKINEEVTPKMQQDVAMSFGPGVAREMFSGYPPFEGLNKPLTIRGLDEAIAKEEKQREGRRSWINDRVDDKIKQDFIYTEQNLWPVDDEELNNHPFFSKDLWSDKKEND